MYARQDSAGLDEAYALLFKALFQNSVQMFTNRLETATNHYSSGHNALFSLLDTVRTGEFSEYVNKVEALFIESKFKGFIVNVAAHDSKTKVEFAYEVLYRKRTSKELIKAHDISNRLLEELTSTRELFLNSLIRMEISTDYDQKERRFSNYVSIMNEKSNPTVLMEFDPIERPLEFYILWIDKNSKSIQNAFIRFFAIKIFNFTFK